MLNDVEAKEFQRFLKRIGRNMRQVRKEANMTQNQASEEIGIGLRYYQRIESGEYPMSVRNLLKIALRLKVDLTRLVSS